MPDGSHAAVHPPAARPSAQAREPALGDALDRLFACAGQGLPPDEVLRDIRALLIERGLLDAGPTRHRPEASSEAPSGAPPPGEAPGAHAPP